MLALTSLTSRSTGDVSGLRHSVAVLTIDVPRTDADERVICVDDGKALRQEVEEVEAGHHFFLQNDDVALNDK